MHYLLRRGLVSIAVILLVANLDFFLPRLIPDNAALTNTRGSIGEAVDIHSLTARYHLNLPMQIQYFDYMKGLFATWPPNLGVSFEYYPMSVINVIGFRIGWTFGLIFVSLGLALLIVFTMAAVSSTRRGGKFEVASLYMSLSFHSIPVYWFSIVLLWVFGVVLGWFPVFGSVDPGLKYGTETYVISVIRHGVLPVIALTLSLIGELYLTLRSSIQDVLQSDYVIAAELRGLRRRILAIRYILRNSLLPIVSLLTYSLAGLIGRIILIEAIFGYPGLGYLIIDGINTYDYPIIEGTFFILVLMVVIGGFVGDILLMKLDPRLRVSNAL